MLQATQLIAQNCISYCCDTFPGKAEAEGFPGHLGRILFHFPWLSHPGSGSPGKVSKFLISNLVCLGAWSLSLSTSNSISV